MGPHSYTPCYRPYVHTWPGQARVKSSCKHSATRKARFKARHA